MILRDYYEGNTRDVAVDNVAFEASYDVIVAGLGTAGAIAALAAAREGVSVFGIEQMNAMGGTGTLGGIWSYYTGNKGGLYKQVDEFSDKLATADIESEGDYHPHGRFKGQSGQYKAEALELLCKEAGVKYVYGATVTGVYMEGSTVVGVRWFDGVNSRHTASKFVIDCTAEGCVCLAAGCAMNSGRDSDMAYQPYSNIMISFAEGRLHFANTDSGTLDQYDPLEYGYATLYSATTPMFLQKKYHESWRFVGLAPILGIREGKTIVGEECMTASRVMNEIEYGEDGSAVFYGMSHIDDHSQDLAYGDVDYCEIMTVCGLWSMLFYFGIPMGAMIPRGFDGLLAAGRMVSVDHALAQAMRMKDDIQKSGEAAGLIAALAISGNTKAKDVDRESLKAKLRETGCLKDGDCVRLHPKYAEKNLHNGEKFPKDVAEYKTAFASSTPGLHIYAAKYMPDDFGDTLAEWLGDENPLVSRNSALALAMRRDNRGVEVLMSMMTSRDGYTTESSIYAPNHALAAISALGMLGAAEAVPTLFTMLSLGYAKGIPFRADALVQDETALVYQYFTQVHMALIRIAEQNPALRSVILAKLDEVIFDPKFALKVGLRYTANTMSDRTHATRIVQSRVER